MSPTIPEIDVPLAARIRLGHAVLQAIADDEGIDVLHIKGYAVDDGLYVPGRSSTDVDLLVRPHQAAKYLRAIERHGWQKRTSFRSGSIFEHAAVAHHESWGYADVHRVLPGVGLDATQAFDRLWAASALAPIADFPCRVPSRLHQAMIVVLHDARSPGTTTRDVLHLRESLPDDERHALRAEAATFDAEIAWAAATGRLEEFRDHPQYPLWAAVRSASSRLDLLRARVSSAPSFGAKLRLVAGAALPNRDHLRMSLGHEPTPRDYLTDMGERARAAFAGARARLAERFGPTAGRATIDAAESAGGTMGPTDGRADA